MESIFNFLDILNNLKFEERFKPIEEIEQGDTVASHTWRLTLLVLITANELKLDIDTNKALKIALLHDLPESITGDIDASDAYDNTELQRKKDIGEDEAMEKIKQIAPENSREEIFKLWKEYRDKSSKEAKLVYSLDKVEGIYTYLEFNTDKFKNTDLARSYHKPGYKLFPELKPLLDHLEEMLKDDFKHKDIKWEKESYE